jgi:hypothetical protein
MPNHNTHPSKHRLSLKRISTLLLSLAFCVAAASASMAGETPRHVVGSADIQARIDQQLDREAADRQAIQQLLAQPGVRQIAETAGLDIERAHAAAALLSGAELKDLASSAREVNAGIGGDRTITITATTLIIILLVIILITK